VDLRLVGEDEDGDDRLLTFDVARGVRAVGGWAAGRNLELTDSTPLDFGHLMSRARRAMTSADAAIVFADELPPAPAVAAPPEDLLTRARRLRLP
jgi:hypothetical protein